MRRTLGRVELLCLLSLAWLLNGQKQTGAVPYPTPHRSWLKMGAIAYGAATGDHVTWNASHIDYFVGPSPTNLAGYQALTNAPLLKYEEYYSIYTTEAKYTALQTYCTNNSLDFETMFLHYDVDTSVTNQGNTIVVPGGTGSASRVPCYYGGSTNRFVLNVANADYQAFEAGWAVTLITNAGGTAYDGLFVDDCHSGAVSEQSGTINYGGTFEEYSGLTRSQALAAFNTDELGVFSAVRTAFGTKGAPGSKLQITNISNTQRTSIFPYVDGVFREFLLYPGQEDNIPSRQQYLVASEAAGTFSIVTSVGTGSSSTDHATDKMAMLAMFYIIADPAVDTFARQDSNSGDLQTYAWFGAMEYDVGHPKAAYYIYAYGIDPASTKIDSGTATVTNSGGMYTFTDGSKSWSPADYWKPGYIVDSAGHLFGVYDSGSNWLSAWCNAPPYPANGAYTVGTTYWKVYVREFGNAIAIAKPYSAIVNVTLPVTSDNPTGQYYPLNVDGTIGSGPITSMTLSGDTGTVLIKASSLGSALALTEAVDHAAPHPGDVLTYTISYLNVSQLTFANAQIVNRIPTNTTYVLGSASNGGSYDGTKITWNLGRLAPGASGTVTFQVAVN